MFSTLSEGKLGLTVSVLRSAADLLAATDLTGLSGAEVEEELVEVSRVLDILQAQFLRLTAEVDRRRTFADRGVLSTSRFLAESCGFGNSTAREKVSVARSLETMPRAAAAFGAGDMSYSKVRVLARAAAAHPEDYLDHEETLVEIAGSLSVRDLHRAVGYWRQQLDDPLSMIEMAERSYVYASLTWDGMVKLDALLDPVAGETVMTAFAVAMEVPSAAYAASVEAGSTAGRRRAEALVDICRNLLDRGERQVGGEKPHITVLVDLETLEGRAGFVCELDQNGSIPAETARRLACDAHVTRVVTQGGGQPLNVGRASRTVTTAQRRAVIVRDRHCRFPGCDRPPRWGDVHHIIHWADGGGTDLDNLILICRRHHGLLHEGGFRLVGPARDPVFWGPSGVQLQPSPKQLKSNSPSTWPDLATSVKASSIPKENDPAMCSASQDVMSKDPPVVAQIAS